MRDQIVDFIRSLTDKAEIVLLDITASKLYDWRERYGKVRTTAGFPGISGWRIGKSRLSSASI